jgi:hypothetical protein
MPHHHGDLLHTAMRQAQTAGYGVTAAVVSREQGMPNTFMVGACLPKIKQPEKWNSMLSSANLMAISSRYRCGILFLLFRFVFGVFRVRHRACGETLPVKRACFANTLSEQLTAECLKPPKTVWTADVTSNPVELGVFVPGRLPLGRIRFPCPRWVSWFNY